MDADVLVVGLGSMGSMALWRLAERGVKVAGFDRFRPPHTMGSHHGGSRIIRTAYYEGAGYVPLARRSFELWRELAQKSGRELLVMTSGLHMGPPDSPEFSGALLSAREHGVAHEVLDAAAVSAAVGVRSTRSGSTTGSSVSNTPTLTVRPSSEGKP